MSSKNYRIACIPADGIGPEVIDAGIQVLEALSTASKSFTLDFEHYDWSSETYKKTGKYIPDNGLEELKKHDAIFFGAVGAPGKFYAFQVVRYIKTDEETQMYPITFRSGVFVWLSARGSSNTQTSVRQRSSTA